MLRRIPTTTDGKVVDRLQESTRINKPFKPPSLAVPNERVQPARKRKRVSYKGLQENDSGGDDDNDDPRRKKKKKDNKDGAYTEEELRAAIPKFPVYKPKPFEQVFGPTRRFSMPSMRGKDGKTITLVSSNISLGTRPQTKLIPRPLHDPMEDHAIVLYDPTIDDRETDEERKEREKQEAKELSAKEAREKSAGMYNPHKSLRDLLGEGQENKKVHKVPVVIDPRLTKVL
jgi:DNA repair and recombination RAD54-like protein